MQFSTTLFSFATPILWSAQVRLDIFRGLTFISNEDRCGIDIDEDALAQIERANVLGEEIRVGSLPWRWRNYLRSVRSLELDLSSSDEDDRKLELEVLALRPHLPASFDAVQVSMVRCYGLTEESIARHREWAEWLLNRLHGRAVRHVLLKAMSPAEMEPFFQLRPKKLTMRDEYAPHDIKSALGKINDLETLVLGEGFDTVFCPQLLDTITDVVKRYPAFQNFCLESNILPEFDNNPPKLTQLYCLMENDELKALFDILKTSRSQMKELRMHFCVTKPLYHTAFWDILSTMTSLTTLELKDLNVNITDLSSAVSKLTNLQNAMFDFDYRCTSGTFGVDIVCLPKLRHLKVSGLENKPENVRVNFGLGLKTLSIGYAVLVFDYESLSITGMPHLEELTLCNASVAPTTLCPNDVDLAKMLEDPAMSPSLARVQGIIVHRLNCHVDLLKYGLDDDADEEELESRDDGDSVGEDDDDYGSKDQRKNK
ncbi:hypothetical protein HK101_002597 [Irineochytrium annulatum]|nr:hypothetical protein HK101_002597 [Irineochytrium annulatum]